MPCGDHQASNKNCVDCLASDIIALVGKLSDNEKLLKPERNKLANRYKELFGAPAKKEDQKRRREQEEYICSLIAGLNPLLAALKEKPLLSEVDGGFEIDDIGVDHRNAYLARLRRRGTWIGFAEFTVLAALFRVRFYIMIPAGGATHRRYEVGDPDHSLIANPALRWTGDHYEVATHNYHAPNLYTCNNVIATNPFGDCGLESFLIALDTALQNGPLRNQVWHHYSAAQRTILRSIRELVAAANGALLDADAAAYRECISDLRELLAGSMTEAEVNHAIYALGRLPEVVGSKKEKSKEELVPLPKYVVAGEPADLPWGDDFVIHSKRINQAGYRPQAFTRVAGQQAYHFGANFNPSGGVWTGALAFLAGREEIGGSYDADLALSTELCARKELDFIDTEGTDMDPRPTHIGACLVAITVGKATHYFLAAGVNMHPGKGAGAQAQMCTLGTGNGLHSEKYVMGLTCFLLRGFGVKVNDKLLEPLGDFGRVAGAPAERKKHGVARVDLFFLNIAPMCETCEGFWGHFRGALIEAGIEEVNGYVWAFAHDIKNWK